MLEMIGQEKAASEDLEGVSLVPLLQGREIEERSLYWYFSHYSNHGMQSPASAIRSGKYKLLEYFENGTVQLFDLEKDLGEQVNLAERESEIVERLQKDLHAWRKEVGAQMMKENPDYDPSLKAEDYYLVK